MVYRDYITNSTFSDESVISSKGSQENMSESEVDTALATLVEGVERLLNSQTNRTASNEYSVSTVSENRGGGASGGLSLDEATKFFPALVTNTASNEVINTACDNKVSISINILVISEMILVIQYIIVVLSV